MVHLIASMGTAPAILTEAIWYLEEEKKFRVCGLTCVGTQGSLESAQAELFSPGGALERLRTRLEKDPTWLGPAQVQWEAGPLKASDSNTEAEAKALDRAFRDAILSAQERGDDPVLACISGGRKTMSSSLQQAMVLLAREQDWAFHVLLKSPDWNTEIELQHSKWGFPGDTFPSLREGSTLPRLQEEGQLGVYGIKVPLVKLREVAMANDVDLSSRRLVESLQEVPQPSKIVFRLSDRQLFGQEGNRLRKLTHLTPNEAILLAAILHAKGNCDGVALKAHAMTLAKMLERGASVVFFDTEKVELLFKTNGKGKISKITTPLCRLRSKLLTAIKKWDPRRMKAFDMRRGNGGKHGIGFVRPEVTEGMILLVLDNGAPSRARS